MVLKANTVKGASHAKQIMLEKRVESQTPKLCHQGLGQGPADQEWQKITALEPNDDCLNFTTVSALV